MPKEPLGSVNAGLYTSRVILPRSQGVHFYQGLQNHVSWSLKVGPSMALLLAAIAFSLSFGSPALLETIK